MKRRELRRLILSKYDSLGDFARENHFDPTALSSHLSGKRKMRCETVLAFARILDIKQEDIGKYFFPELGETDGIQENDKAAC